MLEIDGEPYLDVAEAARSLGVKPETLYAYVARGRLKSYRRGIGRRRLYAKREIDALLALRPAGAVEPAPEADTGARGGEPAIPEADAWASER